MASAGVLRRSASLARTLRTHGAISPSRVTPRAPAGAVVPGVARVPCPCWVPAGLLSAHSPRYRGVARAPFALSALPPQQQYTVPCNEDDAASTVEQKRGALNLGASALGASLAVLLSEAQVAHAAGSLPSASFVASLAEASGPEPLSYIFFKTLIAWGVPVAAIALPAIAVALISAKGRAKRSKEQEGEDDEEDSASGMVSCVLLALSVAWLHLKAQPL